MSIDDCGHSVTLLRDELAFCVSAGTPVTVSYERGTPVTVSYERGTPVTVSYARGTPVSGHFSRRDGGVVAQRLIRPHHSGESAPVFTPKLTRLYQRRSMST